MDRGEAVPWDAGSGRLLQAIEENHWESQRALAHERLELGGGFAALSESPIAWLSSAFLTDTESERAPCPRRAPSAARSRRTTDASGSHRRALGSTSWLAWTAPVGAGSLFLGAGARLGFRVAVLYSSEAAEGLYARLGFLPLGERHQYLWRPR